MSPFNHPYNIQINALKDWTGWLAKYVIFAIVFSWVIGWTPYGRDDTDSGSWGGGRSGMVPATDALTGCQYLRTQGGGITPRLNSQGKQLGCKRDV